MARKLKILLNIGLEDQAKYGIPNGPDNEPPHEGDVLNVDDAMANILVNVMKCAEDYDSKKESEREEKIRKFDEANIAQHEAGMRPRTARTSRQFNTLGKDDPREDQPLPSDPLPKEPKAK